MFITSVDVFFATKSANIPVTCQIRTVVNGFPSEEVLPLANKVLNPSSVNLDSPSTGTAATTFTFEAPIYLRDNTEYCIVLLANTQDYTAVSYTHLTLPTTD